MSSILEGSKSGHNFDFLKNLKLETKAKQFPSGKGGVPEEEEEEKKDYANYLLQHQE